MKHLQLAKRQAPEANPYWDETMAMVYVGDVYSLVAQHGAVAEAAKAEIEDQGEKPAPHDNRDVLWPFVR